MSKKANARKQAAAETGTYENLDGNMDANVIDIKRAETGTYENLDGNLDADTEWTGFEQQLAKVISNHRAAATKPVRKNGVGSDKRVITLLVTANPKRGKSFHRYALYQTGMTVDEYVAAGGKRADIAWDIERKFIELG